MRWIVFLRAVNVGGTGKLAMAELRAALEAAGAAEVASYIQSGNLLMALEESDARAVEEFTGAVIARTFGFRPGVMALTPGQIDAALAAAPFPQAEGKHLYFHFFSGTPAPDAAEKLAPFCTQGEEIATGPDCLYVHFPRGSGRSKVSGRIEKALGLPATARNRNTVERVRTLAGD